MRFGDVGGDTCDHDSADIDVATEQRQQREPDVELCNGGVNVLIIFRLGWEVERRFLQSEPETRKEAELCIALDNQFAARLGLHLLLRQVEQRLLVNKHGYQKHRQNGDCHQRAHNPKNHQHHPFPRWFVTPPA